MDEMNRQATGQRAGLEHGSRPFVGAQIVERRARRSGHDVRGDRAAGDRTTYRLHHDSDEVAYVLSREITCKVDDVVTVGGPGVCAFMPHALNNTGTDAAREPWTCGANLSLTASEHHRSVASARSRHRFRPAVPNNCPR